MRHRAYVQCSCGRLAHNVSDIRCFNVAETVQAIKLLPFTPALVN